MRILDALLEQDLDATTIDSLDAWWSRHRAAGRDFTLPIERALMGGLLADRLGYAFASGYEEALTALVPGTAGRKVALSVTEEGGGHPRAIRTELSAAGEGFRLEGAKRFVTLGQHVDELLIAARVGQNAEGRPRLKLVRIDASRDGVIIASMPPTPFVPEIPHATLRLEGVSVAREEVLEGDGYADYVKPFRTVEDLHVHAAVLGHALAAVRRFELEPTLLERLLAMCAALLDLAGSPDERVTWAAPATHLALAGLIDLARALVSELTAALDNHAPSDVAARWRRDAPLLWVAESVRQKRTASARKRGESEEGRSGSKTTASGIDADRA